MTREVKLSSADRVLFPDDGVTKGDLFAYYEAVAPVLIPHLRDRPFTMKRYREGIRGPVFFQKQAPKGIPDWIPTKTFRTWPREGEPRMMLALRDMLPPESIWAGFGIGRMQMPMAAQAVLLGGNVRVGLEDNLYLDRGVPASNGSLVERAVTNIEALGSSVAGPAEAREILGLKAPRR